MENKHLLDNESIITQSDENVITLTNLRLRYSDSQWGKSDTVSMLLEKISSIEIHYRSKTILVILAIFATVGGLIGGANGDDEFIALGIGAGIVLIILYLFSRKHYLTISSDGGGKIHFHTKGMKKEVLLDFINKIESAIRLRREELK